jgi:pyrroloquinoline quinone (PQQ) biosynthesis protein C
MKAIVHEAEAVQLWRERIGERVRASMASSEMERYFGIKMTIPRARIALGQLSLYVRCRRDCWANVLANCANTSVRQRLLEHEYDELVKDEYSPTGHLDLIIRQGKLIGLSPDDFLQLRPLTTSLATFYGWKWIAREKPWPEALVAMMATEWVNDDRVLPDRGGGLSRRDGLRWMRDLGFKWEEMPNFAAHSEADEKHGDLFLPLLPDIISEQEREEVLATADEALELFELYHRGVAEGMEKLD